MFNHNWAVKSQFLCQLKYLTDIFSNCIHIWPYFLSLMSELNIECKLKDWDVYVISHFLNMQYSLCIWSVAVLIFNKHMVEAHIVKPWIAHHYHYDRTTSNRWQNQASLPKAFTYNDIKRCMFFRSLSLRPHEVVCQKNKAIALKVWTG